MVIADIVRLQGKYEIVGFLDNLNPVRHGTEFCGAPILGGEDQLDNLHRMGVRHLILGFGDCSARLRLSTTVRARDFDLATIIHPRSIIAPDVPIGAGTVIVAGAVINPGAKIGENVIINTCASVGHECIVEDGAHIAPGVRLGGGCMIGKATWVGIGATVRDHTNIGERTLIGAGAVVVKDIPDGVVAYGVPAKIVRKVTPNDN